MDKSNLELFKQALREGLNKKFDSIVNGYTEEIVCSERHRLAMRTILYGKADTGRSLSSRAKIIIAIVVAVALLLTSCGIIFRNQIREVFDELFVKYISEGNGVEGNTIEEVYELTYLPEGYTLEEEKIQPLRVSYKFIDGNGNVIKFEQRVPDGSGFTADSESGYSQIKEIEGYNIYYKCTSSSHYYIWNDGKYSMQINSFAALPAEQILAILKGITVK